VCALNKWLREGRDFIGALEAENYAVADAHHSLSEALIYFHGRAGEIELELVPQGNLAERIRAAGAGIGGFFTPTGFGTQLAQGKETRNINGRDYLLEYPIKADFALIKAQRGDRWGNLVYRKAARNFNPIMAMAAACTVAQVDEIVPLGALDPEHIVTPGIFVQRVVSRSAPAPAAPATSQEPTR
jgi:3-oxoadipate CoA-transferase alpha subunit